VLCFRPRSEYSELAEDECVYITSTVFITFIFIFDLNIDVEIVLTNH